MARCVLALGFVAAMFVVIAGCVPPPSNRPPVAGFTWSPTAPASGEAVTFTDQSQDEDGSVVGWSWQFGDGGSSSVRNATHTYTASGDFTASLTVTDDDGASSTCSQTVAVSPDPCLPNPSVWIWLDRTTFSRGEAIAVYFSANKAMAMTMLVEYENGSWKTLFSGQLFASGQYVLDLTAGTPAGNRLLHLTGTDACGHSDTASVAYTVTDLYIIQRGCRDDE